MRNIAQASFPRAPSGRIFVLKDGKQQLRTHRPMNEANGKIKKKQLPVIMFDDVCMPVLPLLMLQFFL